MDAPDVSVVIPTRNRWHLLSRRALRAALLQEGVEHEVLVVDDGSTDQTPEALRQLGDPRVRLVRHERPGGSARARNAGIEHARGDWIAFLDDDDVWDPRKLRRQLDAVRATGADFVYSSVVTVDDSDAVLYVSSPPAPERLRYETIARCAIPAGPSNVLVRAELVRKLGGFDEALLNMEDWDLWIRLAWAGTPTSLDEILVAYLEHREGKSLTRPRDTYERLRYLERKHRGLMDEHGVDIDRVAFAHYAAWLQLRSRRHARAAQVYFRSAVENRRPRDLIPAGWFTLRALLPVKGRLRPRRASHDRGSPPPWLHLYR